MLLFKEEVKFVLNLATVFCYLVQNLPSSPLLHKNVSIKIYKNLKKCSCLFKNVTYNVTHQTGVVPENGVLRGLFVPKREEITADWRKKNNEGTNQVTLTVRHYSDKLMGHVTSMGKLQ